MTKNKFGILLLAMLKSTSGINTIKYCNDKKKKSKIIGGYIGYTFLILMLIFMIAMSSLGIAMTGQTEMIPQFCAISIGAIAFIFTLLRSNGFLFGFKEYDMLMAMPFEIKDIIACKFIYMYSKQLLWYFTFSVANLIVYGVFAKPAIYVYPLWLLLTFFIPIIPGILASAIGVLIVRIGIKSQYKKIFQTIFTFAFVLLCFFSRFIIEAIFRSDSESELANGIANASGSISQYFFTAKWFGSAITSGNVLAMLGIIVVNVAVFVVFFRLIAKSYRMINSNLKVGMAKRGYKSNTMKKSSVIKAVAFKEYRMLVSSTAYLTNATLGELLALIVPIIFLVIGGDKALSVILNGAPVTAKMLLPSIPIIIYFFIGMVATTAISPSLEGKNYWIIQSMPIKMIDLYKGKLLFNLLLATPFAVVGTVLMDIAFSASLDVMILHVLSCVVLCIFSSVLGLVCGIKFIKLEWENEIEVIKQGAAVAIYMLPNMFVSMGLVVLAVFLGTKMDGRLVVIGYSAIYLILSLLLYLIIQKMAKKR